MRLVNALVVVCVVFVSCRARPSVDPLEQVALARGLRNCADTASFHGPKREGRDSIAAELKRRGETPGDWYTVAAVLGDSLVVYEMWHRASLAPRDPGWRGNPGGRNFNANYDLRQHRIVAWLLWQ